jgi:hypothetical protein
MLAQTPKCSNCVGRINCAMVLKEKKSLRLDYKEIRDLKPDFLVDEHVAGRHQLTIRLQGTSRPSNKPVECYPVHCKQEVHEGRDYVYCCFDKE